MAETVTAPISTRDGLHLVGHTLPAARPRAHLLLVHGYAEHMGRYAPHAQRLVDAGFSVSTYDQRGHGVSPGRRAYVPDYQLLVDDLAAAVETLKPDQGPFFMLGHSMGGGVLAHYAARKPTGVDGFIFSSALLGLSKPPGLLLRTVNGLAARLLPTGPVPRVFYTLDPAAISALPEEVARYAEDPLVYHGPILNRTAWTLNRMVVEVQTRFPHITHPLLVVHGTDDAITDPEGSKRLVALAPAADKTLKLYPGGRHELLNDVHRLTVTADLIAWLEAHL